MHNEVWRPVVGFEKYYEISSLGRIRRLSWLDLGQDGGFIVRLGNILKPFKSGRGYMRIHLKDIKGNRFAAAVHRLVAMAFLPNPDNLPQVNHKDENKTNNSVSNLEWCDASYNMRYGNRKRKNGRPRRIWRMTMSGVMIDEFPTMVEASRCTGISKYVIEDALKGVQHSAGGYVWRYASA